MKIDPRIFDPFAGLRVVSDVHGYGAELKRAVSEAASLNMFVIMLGDIVDRGPEIPLAMRTALDVIEHGAGIAIPGNHEDKFVRWRKGNKVKVDKNSLLTTSDQLNAVPDGDKLARRFAASAARWPVWLNLPNCTFVHAAFMPDMINTPAPALEDRREQSELSSFALWGENNGETDDLGRYIRTYGWVDDVPAGHAVFVGHDTVDLKSPVIKMTANGGLVAMTYTGVDRGGAFSYIDLPLRHGIPLISALPLSPEDVDIAAA